MSEGQELGRALASAVVVLALSAEPLRAQCTALDVGLMTAADGAAQDQFGLSVAFQGETAIVGAWLDDNPNGTDAGAAYVFKRSQGGPDNWGQVAKLIASDGMPADAFGWSVDIDGTIAAVGAYRNDTAGSNAGKVYVFERDQGGLDNWGQVAVLQGSGLLAGDQFGYALAVDSVGVVVGAHRADTLGVDSGTAYVFVRNQGGPANYGQVAQLFPLDGSADDAFGRSVAKSGSTVLVGAIGNDGVALDGGAVYVFDQNKGGPGNFGQVKKLVPADAGDGDNFGFSVGVDGPLAVIGAYGHDVFGIDAGAAYLFDRNQGGGNNWGQVTKLIGSGSSAGDVFGYSVAVRIPLVAVGSYLEGSGGAAYTFGQNHGGPNAWGQAHRLEPANNAPNDRFGFSVDLFSTTLVAGATHADLLGNNAGASYAFDLALGAINYCTAGTSASGCQALLTTLGVPSASASLGFSLLASGAEGGGQGLFFFSTNGRQANPWGNGTSYQCVTPPVKRTPILTAGGLSGSCTGSFLLDLNAYWCSTCPAPHKNPGTGAAVQAQCWYRDPFSTSNQTTSLSDAIEFSPCP